MKMRLFLVSFVLCSCLLGARAFGDGAECDGWGEFRGIRTDGQLTPFSTSVKLAGPDGGITAFSATQTVGNQQFARNGHSQMSSATIGRGGLAYRQIVEDTGPGTAKVTISVLANGDLQSSGVFYYVTLPADLFSGGKAEFLDVVDQNKAPVPVTLNPRPAGEKYAAATAKGIRITAPGHKRHRDSPATAACR